MNSYVYIFGGPEETRTLKKYCICSVNLQTVFILCSTPIPEPHHFAICS
nr:MAG TPA: hypothetical protein [Caudoviricetes sp.]